VFSILFFNFLRLNVLRSMAYPVSGIFSAPNRLVDTNALYPGGTLVSNAYIAMLHCTAFHIQIVGLNEKKQRMEHNSTVMMSLEG